jgi:hypothetical protein
MAEEKKASVGIDLNNLAFEPENLEVDPDKDQFQSPPPPEEGTFVVKLSQKEVNGSLWVRGETKKGKRYLQTAIEARIIQPDGKYDNWPVFDNFVSTLVQEGQGTNKIVGILKCLGHEVPRTTSDVELAKKLTEVLAGNPICKMTTQWEGYCESCEKTVLKGQKRWPTGKHITECAKDGSSVTAQARPIKYLPQEAA